MMFTTAGGVSFSAKNEGGLTAYGLRSLGLDCPLGIDTQAPELSWRLISGGNNSSQSAYEIEASDSEDFSSRIWSSGIVESKRPFGAVYGGGYVPRQRVFWRVRVRDEKNVWSEF